MGCPRYWHRPVPARQQSTQRGGQDLVGSEVDTRIALREPTGNAVGRRHSSDVMAVATADPDVVSCNHSSPSANTTGIHRCCHAHTGAIKRFRAASRPHRLICMSITTCSGGRSDGCRGIPRPHGEARTEKEVTAARCPKLPVGKAAAPLADEVLQETRVTWKGMRRGGQ